MPLQVESVDLMPIVEEIVEDLVRGTKPSVTDLARRAARVTAPAPDVAAPALAGLAGLVGGLALVARPRLSRAERRRQAELERINRGN